MIDIYGVRILRAEPAAPCVVCEGYPAGWGFDVAYRGRVRLCERHENALRQVIRKDAA